MRPGIPVGNAFGSHLFSAGNDQERDPLRGSPAEIERIRAVRPIRNEEEPRRGDAHEARGTPEKQGWLCRTTCLLIGASAWSVVVGVALGTNLTLDRQAVVGLALAEARTQAGP